MAEAPIEKKEKGDDLMAMLFKMTEKEAKDVIARMIGTGEAHTDDGLLDCIRDAMTKGVT